MFLNDLEKCLEISKTLGKFFQYIIYHFNDHDVRNKIVMDALSKRNRNDIQYFGTVNVKENNKKSTNVENKLVLCEPYETEQTIWPFSYSKNESLGSFLQKMVQYNNEETEQRNEQKIALFFACLHYNTSSVHYVTFLLFPRKEILISMDSGIDLYPRRTDYTCTSYQRCSV